MSLISQTKALVQRSAPAFVVEGCCVAKDFVNVVRTPEYDISSRAMLRHYFRGSRGRLSLFYPDVPRRASYVCVKIMIRLGIEIRRGLVDGRASYVFLWDKGTRVEDRHWAAIAATAPLQSIWLAMISGRTSLTRCTARFLGTN